MKIEESILLRLHRIERLDDPDLGRFLDTLAREFPKAEKMRPGFFLDCLREKSKDSELLFLTAYAGLENSRLAEDYVGVICISMSSESPAAYLWYLAVDSIGAAPLPGENTSVDQGEQTRTLRHGSGLGHRLYQTLIQYLRSNHSHRYLIFETERPDTAIDQASRDLAIRRLHYYLSASEERVWIALDTPYCSSGDLVNQKVPYYLCSDAFGVPSEERVPEEEYDFLIGFFADGSHRVDAHRRLSAAEAVRHRYPRVVNDPLLRNPAL